jgi:cytochrome bd-type quinol oxidase subunit 2
MNNISNKARQYGPKAIEFTKVFFVLAFVILAITNRDQRYLKKQPISTTFEILFAGLGGAMAFLYVASSRGVENSQLFAVSFVVFAALQLLFELAGFNEVKVDESNKGAKKFEEQAKKVSNSIAFKILVGIALLLGILLCFVAKDSPFPQITPGQFGYEALAMGLGAAIPTIMVTLDRGGNARNVLINFVVQFFIFGVVAHPFLQYSGMYSHLFSSSP